MLWCLMTVVIGILASICSITRMILHMCRKSFAKSVISCQCLAGSPIGRLAGNRMPVIEGHTYTYNCSIHFSTSAFTNSKRRSSLDMPVIEGHAYTYNCSIHFLHFPLQARTGDLHLMMCLELVRSSANFV